LWHPSIDVFDNAAVDVHHATLGIIGLGRIGSEVARRASGFDMNILYSDVERRTEVEQDVNAAYVSQDELLAQSDVVTLHVPLNDATRALIGEPELVKMKSSAILINTSRGPVIDQAALVQALQAGQIAGAGLDVTDPEPMRAEDPLLGLPQVIVLPHVGSATRNTRLKMVDVAVRNLSSGLQGQQMVACVNPGASGTGRNK
jgi:phosphoglycerate dehydrogenase-like enzyme